MSDSNYYCPECDQGHEERGFCEADGNRLLKRSLNVSEQANHEKPGYLGSILEKFKDISDDNRPELPELPEILKELKVESSLETCVGYHQWKCSLEKKSKFYYRRFQSGSLTTDSTYEHLKKDHYRLKSEQSCFPLIEAFGAVKCHGGYTVDYELTEYDDSYSTANEWFYQQESSEQAAITLAIAFGKLLQDCLERDVIPLAISPSDLLIKRVKKYKDIHFRFAHLAAMTSASQAVVYRGDLSTVLLPAPWAAPELLAGRKATTNSVIFSIGQFLSRSLFGDVFEHDDIRNGLVPFSRIKDEFVANLLMGCLWPEPEGRFNPHQFIDMLDKQNGKPEKWSTVSAWESLRANGSTGISFAGNLYFRARDLVQALVQPEDWDQAIPMLPDILNWVKNNTHHNSLAEMLLASERSEDWKLIRLAHTIAPELPKTWRTLTVDDENVEKSLIALGQGGLQKTHENDGTLINQFFSADLRDAFPKQEIES